MIFYDILGDDQLPVDIVTIFDSTIFFLLFSYVNTVYYILAYRVSKSDNLCAHQFCKYVHVYVYNAMANDKLVVRGHRNIYPSWIFILM